MAQHAHHGAVAHQTPDDQYLETPPGAGYEHTDAHVGPMIKEKKKIPARLIDTGGFAKKDRITHRIEITSLSDIDDDVKKWLKTAYELDAK